MWVWPVRPNVGEVDDLQAQGDYVGMKQFIEPFVLMLRDWLEETRARFPKIVPAVVCAVLFIAFLVAFRWALK